MQRSDPAATAGPATGPEDAGPATILVVDDELLARDTLHDLLAAQGYNVITAVDAEGAFRHLHEADLVLLDAMLPGKDGWAVCAEIKRDIDPLLPIIMVTARTAPDDVVRTFEAGADDYVPKPFQVAELTARIESRLRAHQTEQALQEANRQASQLAEQNYGLYEKALQDAEERANLLRELDHRVRNNLSVIMGLVSMERNRNEPRPTEQALESLENRLRAFLTAYEALRRRGYRGVPLREISERLAQRLRNASDPDGRVALELDCADLLVDEHTGFSLSLALNELIANALRHAFHDHPDPRLTITVDLPGEDIRIVVADNGPGIPPGTDIGTRGSGLSVVRSLVETELGGTVVIAQESVPSSTPHPGLHITLTTPFGGPEA